MRQNFVAQLVQLLQCWLYNMQSDVVMGKKWALSVDQYWLQALQFSVPLINLLSILLSSNGFTGIQKAVVDQTGNRPPNSDHDLFSLQVWLWETLWSFVSVHLIVASFRIKSTFCHLSQSNQEMFHCCCVE